MISTYLQEYADYLKTNERSPMTVAGYTNDISLFIRWYTQNYQQDFELSALSNAIIREYKQALQQQNARPRTINRRVASLASFGLWAQQAGYVQSGPNPTDGIHPVKQTDSAPRWLDPRDRARLLRTIDDEVNRAMTRFPRMRFLILRDAVMVKVMLYTGLRVSELVNLRLADINLEDNRGYLIVRAGKGSKRRELPLNAEARRAIKTYLQFRPDLPVEMLFIGQNGEGIEKRTAQRAVSRFAAQANLGEISCHVLRHTFAKSLVDRGVTLDKVAMLLGHENLNTTRIYTTPGRSDLEQAVNALDQAGG